MNLDKFFDRFPVLETERLHLREPRLTDANALFRVFGDPEAMAYYGPDVPHRNVAQTANLIRELHGYFAHRQGIRWAITLKDGDDTVVGTLGFHRFDVDARHCEVGYELRADHWRQGIMTEAVRHILDFAFDEVGCNRIEAGTDDDNPRSHGLLRKLGFQHEGMFRQRLFYKEKYWDEHWFGLMKADYRRD